MLKGMFTASSSMVLAEHQMNLLSNNISNVNVHGFKKDIAVGKAFPALLLSRLHDTPSPRLVDLPLHSLEREPYVGRLGTGVEYNESYTDLQSGSFEASESLYDLALFSEGFFSVETNQGIEYTRNGNFVLGKEGFLETTEGFLVLGQNGPLLLGQRTLILDEQGSVWAKDAEGTVEYLDRLAVIDFPKTRYLEKTRSASFKETPLSGTPFPKIDVRVKQGYLETSNVAIVKEMVEMIKVNRAYEANQKIIQTYDSMGSALIRSAQV